jgi:two-component system, NtrC family, sensor histidine kinase HydH
VQFQRRERLPASKVNWGNGILMSEMNSRRRRSRRLWLAAAAGGILATSAMHHLAPPDHVHWQNVLQVLYYVPTVLGALLFGWRIGLGLGILAVASHTPYVFQAGVTSDYAVEQAIEMPLLCVVGVLTGVLSDRDRSQRRDLERTTRRLAEVYAELQKNFEQMKRAERLFAVGQLAAGLAHELRNPLLSISGAAGILGRNTPLEAKHRECVEIIQKESQRLNRLLTEFLDFARPRPPKYQSFNVSALLDSAMQLSSHAVGRNGVELRKVAGQQLPFLEGDPELVKQMLVNLVINAIQSMPQGGEVTVSAGVEEGKLLIRVEDQGCGVPLEIRDKIFDPFFTTKESGTGLGLAVAHRIAEQHSGVLRIEASSGRGTVFSVLLPLAREVNV